MGSSLTLPGTDRQDGGDEDDLSDSALWPWLALVTRTPSAEVPAAILAAAEQLLTTEGPSALSVRRIATTAGVAPMGVYNHFGSKNGVIDALYRASLDQLTESFGVMVTIEDPMEAILEGLRGYRRLALSHRTTFQVMFRWWALPSFEPTATTTASAEAAIAKMVAAVARAMDVGLLVGPSPEEVTQQLWAAIHGWVSIEGAVLMEDWGDADTRADEFLDVVIRGLRP